MDQAQPAPEDGPAAGDTSGGDDRARGARPNDIGARAASIASDHMDVWASQWERWHTRARDKRVWSAEDVVGDHTDLFEHLTPIVQQSIELSIDLLRPWAKSFPPYRPAPGPNDD
jgi:hypothetical protein